MTTFHPLAYSNWTSRIGRRQFLGAAAAAAAVLPARALWADVPSAKIPDSLTAVGSRDKPVTLTAADIKNFRASMQGQLIKPTAKG